MSSLPDYPGGVAVLCINPKNGLILSVARRHNHNLWTLPGGKIDPGETPLQAALREFKEETGFYTSELDILYADINEYDGKVCVTYEVDGIGAEFFAAMKLKTPEGEAPVSWQTAEVLVAGPFGEYNKRLFDHIGVSYGSSSTMSISC